MAFVQGAHNESTPSVSTLTATFGAGITSGNTVWGIAAWGATGKTPTITIGGVSATILDTVTDAPNGIQASTFILGNVSGSPTGVVLGLGTTTPFVTLIAIEESGCLAVSNPTDVHKGQLQSTPGTGANILTSGNVTTTVANDIIVGACENSTGAALPTAGTTPLAFTLQTTEATGIPVATENGAVKAVTGAVAATFGQTSNNTSITFVIAIKPVVVGGGSTIPQGWASEGSMLVPSPVIIAKGRGQSGWRRPSKSVLYLPAYMCKGKIGRPHHDRCI